ncbi:unnamed protein product [Trichobilharzia regenti]|nr:unnamed protein product [Trichobilharzia regenti]
MLTSDWSHSEVNELRAELINHRQTLVESTKCQYKAETQIDKLLQSTRIELINLRKEAEYQKSEIDKQRSELTEKSRKLQDELDMLHNRLTCTNQFSGNRENNHFDVINTQNNNDEEEEKLQRIIKLFQKHFLLHINEFENKVSSISDRLNLEVDQMQTFQVGIASFLLLISLPLYTTGISNSLHIYVFKFFDGLVVNCLLTICVALWDRFPTDGFISFT